MSEDKTRIKCEVETRDRLKDITNKIKEDPKTSLVGVAFDFSELKKISQQTVLDHLLSKVENKLILKKNKK